MLNLKEIDKDIDAKIKEVFKMLPKEHKSFVLRMYSEIKQNTKDGKPSTDIKKQIEDYVSNK